MAPMGPAGDTIRLPNLSSIGSRGKYVPGLTAKNPYQVIVDLRSVDRAIAAINRYQGKEFLRHMGRAYLAGATLLKRPMEQSAPKRRYPDPITIAGRARPAPGGLRKSIVARQNRMRMGELGAATIGPVSRIAPHRHLVVGGTKPHSLKPKRAGKSEFVRFIPRKRTSKSETAWSRRSGGQGIRMELVQPTDRYVWAWAKNIRHPGASAQPFVGIISRRYAPKVQSFIRDQTAAIGRGNVPNVKIGR